MRLTAMSYNLMRVFEEVSKIQQPELIHPSDKKYSEALEKRQHRGYRYRYTSVKVRDGRITTVIAKAQARVEYTVYCLEKYLPGVCRP